MKKNLFIGVAAVLLATSYASASTFPNGDSYFGSQMPVAQSYRVIDLSQGKWATVDCGETVTFVNKGQKFSFRFDSIRHSRVPISSFAPAGFDTGGKVVYIHMGEYDIRG